MDLPRRRTLPVLLDGKTAGSVTIDPDGGMTITLTPDHPGVGRDLKRIYDDLLEGSGRKLAVSLDTTRSPRYTGW
jgi:hypothetical protein